MAERTATRGTIEEEIEETQRQIRRSAQLIQSAFEGLSTLHGRVTEAAALRTQARTASGSGRTQVAVDTSSSRTVPTPGSSRGAMDPGHDAILLSSPPNPTGTAEPAAVASSSSPSIASISTLSTLGDDLLTSTESVRSRAGELDELRRAIALHSLDRHRQAVQRTLLDPAPGNARLSDTSGDAALMETRAAQGVFSPPIVRSRTLAGDSAFRARSADDPSTSLGAMVTARAAMVAEMRNAPARMNADERREPVSTSIDTTRFSRLAQEIQQDISRISQQSESLMSWIHDNRVRIDAGLAAGRPPLPLPLSLPLPERERAVDRSPSPSANRTPRPAHAHIAAATSALLDTASTVPSATADALPVAASGAGSDAANLTPRERYVLQLLEAANGGHPRYRAPFHTPFPNDGGTPNAPLAGPTNPRTDGGQLLANSTNVPMSPITSPARPSAESHVVYSDTDFAAALSRVRALTRRGPAWNEGDESSSEEEPPQRRRHRVRRRLNADGDVVEQSVPVRVSRSGFAWSRAQGPGRRDRWEQEEEERDVFPAVEDGFGSSYGGRGAGRSEGSYEGEASEEARVRYDAVLGPANARVIPDRWMGGAPRERAGMDADGNVLPYSASHEWTQGERARARAYPDVCCVCGQADLVLVRAASSAMARETVGEEGDRASGYERNRAAMIARAHVLASSMGPGAYSRGTTALPPPPPPAPLPPAGTYSVTSTTQNPPGSLWNDSSVRVRMNATRRFWPRLPELEARVGGVEGPSAVGAGGAGGARGAEAELEQQPVWGSSTPFCPSALPLLRDEGGSVGVQGRGPVLGGSANAKRAAARMPRRAVLAGR
ncbi:hypothetical protein BC628DRAFT_255235 [Trametes gibbosa]|nr:hypothetical protein BC628DRAFT_255235 [Trametes gibbosa]